MLLPINPDHPEPRKIARAVEIIERGGIVAYPTDTVYGLGCDPMNRKAIDRLYTVKQMPRDQQLAILVKDLSNIATYAVVDDHQYRTMKRLVPGPYCFILPASRETPKVLLSRRKTVGVRVPAHPVARALLDALGRPLISTSASWRGEILFDPDEIDSRFDVDLVLDGGTGGMIPSTVVSLESEVPEVLRGGKGPVDSLLGIRPSLLPSLSETEEE
ncbi:MAG: threonylcarbamoyl-AMP synthase [Deltaproteobacteria bacterium]|nr:threonylcarbamoyl-AMP synthase [Deltaproteobacteria bacterium]